ncbi:uncharacterized protein EV154DRAFT_479632 [Mucor mucedo]|uniref:uncharacterized protein n=1 Tax=Mucor mucedo TaxID=29922 RepID=UPI00221FA460|nr:uncharacterized protein EV154DRAFT_479632 [Mucor mucedo]KAI7893193.1 hypothetical protein EV154DRAFT_479632 [Mucor mucedo]
MTPEQPSLEEYLVTTFSRIKDEYGQQLDITLALPTLVELIVKGGQDDSDKKYAFVGEAACQFAVRCILAKQYPKYDDRILDPLAKKFRALQRVNKIIWKEIELKKNVSQPLPQDIIQTMAGVLYHVYGLTAVEKFIENAVIQVAAIALGEATAISQKMNQQASPIGKFHEMVQQGGGSQTFTVKETPSKHWQVEIVAKLGQTSIYFSHSRIAHSKQKARAAICQDILNHLEKHPDFLNQLQQPNVESTDVHPLPISEEDYAVVSELNGNYPSATTSNAMESDPNNVHIAFKQDDDTVSLLSKLLLGPSDMDQDDDMAESPTKKRARGLESIFSPPTPTASTAPATAITSTTNEMEVINTRLEEETMAVEIEGTQEEQVTADESAMVTVKEEPTDMTIKEDTTPAESTIDSYNPFLSSQPAAETNPKILAHFKEVFKHNRNTLSVAVGMPGQSKSIFLSLVLQNGEKVSCESETKQVGPPHGPVFSARVILKSKRYANVFIITEGVSRKKKDAECHAFHKLVNILK